MARHDAERSGATAPSSISNIVDPAPYWRVFAGGSADWNNFLALGESGQDIAMLSHQTLASFAAGAATANWHLRLPGANRVVQSTDFDGDGHRELLIQADADTFIVDEASGELLWQLPRGLIVTLMDVRVADLDADGLEDLLVQDCRCCGVTGGRDGAAFSFKNGFTAAETLWELPRVVCASSGTTVVLDMNADGRNEVSVAFDDHVDLLDGASGAVLASSPSLPPNTAGPLGCVNVDIDGQPGEDLLCMLNVNGQTSVDSGNQLWLLHQTPAGLEIAWSQILGETPGSLRMATQPLLDLDGDGALELVVAAANGGSIPATYVLQASSGAILRTLLDEQLIGTVAQPGAKGLILTKQLGVLKGYRLNRTSELVPKWQLPEVGALNYVARGASRVQADFPTAAYPDTDGDGAFNIVTVDDTGEIDVYSTHEGALQLLSTHALPAGVRPLLVMPAGETASNALLLATSDGTARWIHPNGEDNAPSSCAAQPVLRFGGYYAGPGKSGNLVTPVIGKLKSGNSTELMSVTSAGALQALRMQRASMNLAPHLDWEHPGCSNPVLLGTQSAARVACVGPRENPDPNSTSELLGLDESGTRLWQWPMQDRVQTDILAGDVNGDQTPDLVYQWTTSIDARLRTTVVDGASGVEAWTSFQGSNSQPYGAALADWDGDSVDDVMFYAAGPQVLSGYDGHVLASRTTPFMYGTLSPLDTDGDADLELIFHDGYDDTQAFDHDLSTQWVAPSSGLVFNLGAIAQCPGTGAVLATATRAEAGRLSFYSLTGANGGSMRSISLGAGSAYADGAAVSASGVAASLLGSVSIHANLSGTGQPVAVVGSSDGWLYGVDPCSLAVVFSYQFGVPVGAVVFGDTDNDGLDEMIVSAADGYLYGMKQHALSAPRSVIELASPGSAEDTDEVTHPHALSVAWEAVAGATSYEVSVADAAGHSMLPTRWRSVGNRTQVTLGRMSLESGMTYVSSVRARSAQGISPDTLSDGFRVNDGTANCGGEPIPPPPTPPWCASRSHSRSQWKMPVQRAQRRP